MQCHGRPKPAHLRFQYSANGIFLYRAYDAPDLHSVASQTMPREAQACHLEISHSVPMEAEPHNRTSQTVPWEAKTGAPEIFSYSATRWPRSTFCDFLYIAYEDPEPRAVASQTLPLQTKTGLLGISFTESIWGWNEAARWGHTDRAIICPFVRHFH